MSLLLYYQCHLLSDGGNCVFGWFSWATLWQESSNIFLKHFKAPRKGGKAKREGFLLTLVLCALPVSLATDILTCCSAAAGKWQVARKHPAYTQSHILSFASITQASRNSHITFNALRLGGFSETSWRPIRRLMTWVDCALYCLYGGRQRKGRRHSKTERERAWAREKYGRGRGEVCAMQCSHVKMNREGGKAILVLCCKNIVLAGGLGSTSTDG